MSGGEPINTLSQYELHKANGNETCEEAFACKKELINEISELLKATDLTALEALDLAVIIEMYSILGKDATKYKEALQIAIKEEFRQIYPEYAQLNEDIRNNQNKYNDSSSISNE